MKRPPRKTLQALLTYLHDSLASLEHPLSEWCEIFDLPEKHRKELLDRSGNMHCQLPQFLNLYVCRDLPPPRQNLAEYEPPAHREYHLHSSSGLSPSYYNSDTDR